jgi:hypothetical protein
MESRSAVTGESQHHLTRMINQCFIVVTDKRTWIPTTKDFMLVTEGQTWILTKTNLSFGYQRDKPGFRQQTNERSQLSRSSETGHITIQ